MAESMILSAIKMLDCWLLQEADLRNYDDNSNDNEKLCSLQDEKADLCSVLLEMAQLWKENRVKLYSLLVSVADHLGDINGAINIKKGHSLLVEMSYLWEDDGNDKERLQSFLLQMADPLIVYDEKLYYSLVVEMVDLWNDCKGKLSKKRLQSWLTKKADLCDRDRLFRLLRDSMDDLRKKEMVLMHKVREVKKDFRAVLDFLSPVENLGKLHYFMSDAVEMAHDVQFLLGVLDSDPVILFDRFMFMGYSVRPLGQLVKTMVHIQEWLQETKMRVLETGALSKSQIHVGEKLVVGCTPTHSNVLVGLENEVELLLLPNEEIRGIGPSTTRIMGMCGIGKTTLAGELYNHPAVVLQYERRAWVRLTSRELSRKELLMSIMRHLQVVDDASLMEEMDNESLRQMLSQHLEGKQYFIVLDDVSENTYLEYVFHTLPKDERSRLLFTTRNAHVRCKPYEDYDHKMKNLDEDRSWQLLLKTAFLGSNDEEFPKQLEKKGKVVLNKNCNGLPSAIKEVGRQWAEKRMSGIEWEQVIESSSIDLNLSETLEALESTYQNLDPDAKSCFLRLPFFNEGATIKEKKLLQIWTVGGLEKEETHHSLYVLISESILEAKEMIKICNTANTYCVNAVFRKLSIAKAGEEIGLEIVRKDGCDRVISHVDKPRHRVIYCGREGYLNYNDSSANQDQRRLVSLFFHGGSHFEFCQSYWNHFERLKILDMEGFGLKILPETVGELSELRYLGLQNNHLQELPQSLGCLKMLEVLDIAQNFTIEVADIIWEMDSLRHIYMSDIICRKPLKMNSLVNLETLTYISVDNWAYDDEVEVYGCERLFSLRKLGIEEVDERSDVSKVFASLADLSNLSCLILRGFRFRSMPSLDQLCILRNVNDLKLEGRLTRLPTADNFPPKLWRLALVNSSLDDDPMPTLEQLSSLDNLTLQNAYTGQHMVISGNGFPQLSILVIGELWQLTSIQVSQGALRYLRKLEINSCPYLETFPKEICQQELKVVTTKHIAAQIRESRIICGIKKVDIQPYK